MSRPGVAYPIVTGFVAVVWLFLAGSLGAGSILLALGLGLFASFTLSRLQAPGLRIRHLAATLRLVGYVCVEILRSNLAVARIVLRPAKERKSGFLTVPLELKDPYALAALACILTATPGSLWVDFDSRRGELLLHVLDLIDEATWIGIVRNYERRLGEIFR